MVNREMCFACNYKITRVKQWALDEQNKREKTRNTEEKRHGVKAIKLKSLSQLLDEGDAQFQVSSDNGNDIGTNVDARHRRATIALATSTSASQMTFFSSFFYRNDLVLS